MNLRTICFHKFCKIFSIFSTQMSDQCSTRLQSKTHLRLSLLHFFYSSRCENWTAFARKLQNVIWNWRPNLLNFLLYFTVYYIRIFEYYIVWTITIVIFFKYFPISCCTERSRTSGNKCCYLKDYFVPYSSQSNLHYPKCVSSLHYYTG